MQVKVVRDSMNQMLEAWKEIPEKELDLPKPLSESKSSSYPKGDDFFVFFHDLAVCV